MERSWPLVLLASLALAACNGDPANDDDDDTVEEHLVVLTEALPDGRVGEAYEAALEADTADEVTWSLDSGSLPPGIELAAGGVLTGTPTASGDFDLTVLADDGTLWGEAQLRLHVPAVLLISGFGPFSGYPVNPSIEALRPLDGELAGGMDIHVVELPVVWDESWDLLEAAIEEVQPDILIGTGVAGTDAMRYEVTAFNVEWGNDVEGVYASGEEVVEGGPSSLDTQLPVEEMAAAVTDAGFATTLSDDAGTYLCNHIFYHVVHHAQFEATRPVIAGFIHVPPAGDAGCSFEIDDVTEAHELGLEAMAQWLQGDRRARPPEIQTHEAPVY